MNDQSPLIPQGSIVEQKNKSRARVKIAILFVLGVHGVGLLALLLQGCNSKDDQASNNNTQQSQQAQQTANPLPPTFEPTNPTPIVTTTVPAPNAPATGTQTPPNTAEQTPAQPTTGAQDHKIVKGDNYSTLAKTFHVTARAIAEANPGVDATKLQIGQTIHIPAPAPATVAAVTPGAQPGTPAAPANGEQLYSVKSGDNLTKIATDHGTTVKALTALNSLKTTRLTVGQKLKVPAKAATASAAHAATTDTVAAQTAPTVAAGR